MRDTKMPVCNAKLPKLTTEANNLERGTATKRLGYNLCNSILRGLRIEIHPATFSHEPLYRPIV